MSCDDGSDCASGVSCGRLCDGLYLGDDWPCVLLRAFESFACTTLPRRSWIFMEGTITYNRLLARSQALSGLQEQWTVEQNRRRVARSTPPRPLPCHAPRPTPHDRWGPPSMPRAELGYSTPTRQGVNMLRHATFYASSRSLASLVFGASYYKL